LTALITGTGGQNQERVCLSNRCLKIALSGGRKSAHLEYAGNSQSCRKPHWYRESTAHDGDDDELQRFSKWGAGLCCGAGRWCDRREHRERKADKVRRRCEVRPRYSSPNTSSATLIDRARHPVWVLAAGTSRGPASFDGRACVKGLLRCSFLHAILELQSETRHPQSLLATILPRSSRSPRSAPRW
jgi:hypothetical protein